MKGSLSQINSNDECCICGSWFPDEGGKKSNKALVDHVFDTIDRDGGGTITLDEFEAYCLSKMSKDAAQKDEATPGQRQAERSMHSQ